LSSEAVTVTVCLESVSGTDSGATVSATCFGTAFCGVLAISPSKCLSKENRFEGESHWGRSDVGGSSGSSVHSAAAEDCSA